MNPKKKTRTIKEKEPRWKREHKNEQAKKRLRLVKVWVFIFFLLILLGLGIKAWLSYRYRIWDGKSQLNLAISAEETYLLSLDPVASEMVFLKIPAKTEMQVAFGYGFYPLGSVYELSCLEKKEGELLAATLENNLALPVKGWLSFSDRINPQEPKAWLNQVIYLLLQRQAKSNLTSWDLLSLLLANRNVPIYKVETFDLGNLNLLEEIELPDKTKGLKINPEILDSFLQKHFQERKIRQENLVVEVINSTQSPGLAERGARLLTNIGFEVAAVGNQEEKINRCLLIGNQEMKKTFSAERIQQIFDCQWQNSQEQGRADLILVSGEEYQKRF